MKSLVPVVAVVIGVQISLAAAPVSSTRVVERAADHEVIQSVRLSPDGATLLTNTYTRIGNGINYQDANGNWVPSEPIVQSFAGGIVCTGASYQVIMGTNLNEAGAVDLLTSDHKRIVSHPVAIAFLDPVSGKSAVLALIQDCQPELVSSNEIVYPDAFSGHGIQASVVYHYDVGRFSQDVKFLKLPVTPSDFGLSDRTRLEILTEIERSPTPAISRHVLERETNATLRATMAEPDLTDDELNFGEMRMPLGRAFPPVPPATPGPPRGVPVAKQWVTAPGHTALVEALPWKAVSSQLDSLPQQSASTGGSAAREDLKLPWSKTEMAQSSGPSFASRLARITRSGLRTASTGLARSAPQTARLAAAQTGWVMDWNLVQSGGPITFQGGQTYLVDGQVYVYGVTLNSGAIIKYGGSFDTLYIEGTPNAMYFSGSAILTSMNDDSVGDMIDGSNHHPEYGPSAGWEIVLEYLSSDTLIGPLDFRYAYGGIDMEDSAGYNLTLIAASFTDIYQGIQAGQLDAMAVNGAHVCFPDYPSWGTTLYEQSVSGTIFVGSVTTCIPDFDGNDLPDAWEYKYFGVLGNDPNADPDADGLSNAEEHQIGADPTKFSTDGTGMSDGWEVQYFGHINVNPSDDPDGDGLNNLQEFLDGSNPTTPFTDGSGMDDGWEVAHFGQINVDPYADPDGDGYGNLEEYQAGTDPTVFNASPKAVTSIEVLRDSGNSANVDVSWQAVPSATGYTITRDVDGTLTTYSVAQGTTSWTDTTLPAGSSATYTVTVNYAGNQNSNPSPSGDPDSNPTLAIDPEVVRGPTPSDPSLTPLQIVLGGSVPAGVAKIRVYVQVIPLQFRSTEGYYYNWAWINYTPSPAPPASFDVDIGGFVNGVYKIPTSQAPEWAGYQFQLQPVGNDGRVGVKNAPIFVRNAPFVDGSAVVKRNLNFILRAARGGDANGYGALRFNATPDYVAASPYVMEQSLGAPANDELSAFYENWFMRNWVYNSGDFYPWQDDNGNYSYIYFFTGNNIVQDGVGYDPEQTYYNFDGYAYVSGATSPFKDTSSQINDTDYIYLQAAELDYGDDLSSAGISWDGTSESLAMNFANLFGLTYQNVRAVENRYPYGVRTLNVRTIPAGNSSQNPDPAYYSEYFQQTTVPSLSTEDYYFVPDSGVSGNQLSFYPIPGDPNPNDPIFSVNDTTPLIIASVGRERGIYGWAKQSVGNSGKYAYLGQYFEPTSVQSGTGILSEYGEFMPLQPGQFTLKTKADIDTGEQGQCTVYAVSLNVDANHDGFMDKTYGGPDTTSPTTPMDFWVDNGDYGTGVGELIDAKTVVPDYSYGYIRSQFGLENFAPLRIRGVPALPAGYTVTLSCTALSGSPAINLYAVTDSSIGYLSDSGTASGLVGEPSLNGQTPISANRAYTFSPTFFDGSDKYFLFEGAGTGEGQFTLTIYQNGNIVAQSSVWLNLDDIKSMYQRAAGTPDDVSFAPPYNQVGSPDYINYNFDENVLGIVLDSRVPFQQPANEAPQCVVFVHGWNMDYNEYIGFSEEMFKRLYWQGYRGRFCAFRWATLTGPFSYNTSEFRAWKYGLPLKAYLEFLKANLPGYFMNIVAHSMGNIVAGSALYRGLTINNYVLLQAAVPAGCYDVRDEINSYAPFTNLEGNNPTPDNANPDLGYRGYLANVSGNLVNFYNQDDFALATGTFGGLTHLPFLWWLGPAVNWEANQESYKPDSVTVTGLFKHYKYDPNAIPSPQRGWLTLGTFGFDHYVTDPHEMMSFIARPRSKAVGALEGVQGSISGEVNLGPGSVENFGNARSDHSGEFNRPIQQLQPLYNSIYQIIQ